ncbi:MAG: copper homeostasis periplasmic binding protein CopC [Pseudochelatococcus sp.]|jgi:methionine-rich copper-binding protein CopC|uniref:copper homeostasis periplasmic binding protein CopC n=1 Tax=Pseudochelatococcus sp. TaxID=2020869 RepID=UPI003D8CF51A
MEFNRILAGGVIASLMFASPAWSHAHLDRAVPAEQAQESAPPEAVTLSFSQEIELKLSSIKVTNDKGEPVATGEPENVNGDRKSLRVSLPRLAAGVYRVRWVATSVDTHSTNGSYTFTVSP